MDLKSKIILIYGPTASGKSRFALSLAKKINGEIINADSMQVYKELKILSARPYQKDYKKIRHHLYGFQNARKNFSAEFFINNCSSFSERFIYKPKTIFESIFFCISLEPP